MPARLLVVGLVLAALALVAFWRARRRAAFEPRTPRLAPETLPLRPGAPLTALYFTSRLCGACKETAGIVREAAPEVPAIAVSVHERRDLVDAVGVFETPTLLLVDEEGRIRYARVGNPEPAELWTYVREAWDSLDAEGRLPRATRT